MMRMMAGTLGMGFAAAASLSIPSATQAQSNRTEQQVQCSRTVLHYTERGFAFECADSRNENFFLFVVKPGQGYDRVSEVISILREHNTRAAPSGRTRTLNGLWVKYRNAGGPDKAICADVWRQFGSNAQCRAAVDVAFR